MSSLDVKRSSNGAARSRLKNPPQPAAEVLRHLAHPARLRANALTARYFSSASSEASNASALADVGQIVHSAIARMPRLQQEIVRRCDIGGELHRVVAAELSISERHFYRLRSRAIAAVASVLESTRGTPVSLSPSLEALDVALQHVEALEQAGALEAALDRLRRLAPTLGATLARVRVHCRAAEFCAAHGRVDEARVHIEGASATVAVLSPDDAEVGASEVDLAAAEAEAAAGDYQTVRNILRRLLPLLRRCVDERPTVRAIESLVSALLLRAERYRDDGKLPETVAAAREALDALRPAPSARATLGVRANFSLLVSLCLLQNLSLQRIRELFALWSDAMQRGLIREATEIAGDLTALYRIRGAPRQALEFARATLPTIRAAGSAGTVPVVLLEVAAAHQSLDELEAAAAMIDEARGCAVDAYGRSIADLRLAELALQERRFAAAAEAAEWARNGFVKVGTARLAGVAAWVAAEAYDGQAKRRAAISAIDDCLALLGAGSFPYEYSRALRVAAKVTGDRRYLKDLAPARSRTASTN